MRRFLQTLLSVYRVILARLSRKNWRHVLVDEGLRLGGVYVKFLQMLAVHQSTRQWVTSTRAQGVFEQVDYEPIDVDAMLMKARLKHHFQVVNPVPIAAGSYGQVYSATLSDGKNVIIKVLRPTVRKYLKQDLLILGTVTFVLSQFMHGSMVRPHRLFKQFAQATRQETDYITEAYNGEWFRNYFADGQGIVIPQTYVEYGNDSVLVQDYVPGISLSQVMELQDQGYKIENLMQHYVGGSDIWAQLHTLGAELLKASLKADYIMADPHPGNVRLLPDNKVALIDFGLVAEGPENRVAFRNIIHQLRNVYEDTFAPGPFAAAMLAFYDTELSDALSISAEAQGIDFVQILEKFVESQLNQSKNSVIADDLLRDRQTAQLFMRLVNTNNSLGLKLSEKDVLLQRSLSMYLSIARKIGEGQKNTNHFDVVLAALREVDSMPGQALAYQQPKRRMSEEQALEITSNWLSILAESNQGLYKRLLEGMS